MSGKGNHLKLQPFGIEIIVETIKEEHSFWKYVDENIDTISSVSFTIFAPNMPSITRDVNRAIKEMIKSTHAKHITLETKSRNNTKLTLNKNDKNVSSLAKCAEAGGGSFSFLKRGSRTKIQPKNIQKTTTAVIEERYGKELPLDDTEKSSDSILTKIRKLFKRR